MSEQPQKKEAGPSTDPTPPQTLHGNGDPEKGASEVQETKGNPEKKKREYKEFTHDEEKATRMSHNPPVSFLALSYLYSMLMTSMTFSQM